MWLLPSVSYYFPSLLCFVVMLGLFCLGSISTVIICLYLNYRLPIQKEVNYIEPLLKHVIDNHNNNYVKLYKYSDFKYFICDTPEVFIRAFSKKCIIITRGALDNIKNDEFMALLAHEFGRIYYNDAQIFMIELWVTLPAKVINYLYLILWSIMLKFFKTRSIIFLLGFLALFGYLIFLIPRILAVFSQKFFRVFSKFMIKTSTSRADYYCYKIGYAQSLLSILDRELQIGVKRNNVLCGELSLAPHQRIKQLDNHIKSGTIAKYEILSVKRDFSIALIFIILLGLFFISSGF